MLALGALFALANLLTAPQDPGWIASNPSPWVAFPLLVGLRHGFRCGFAAGASASALILLSVLLTQPQESAESQLLFFLALPALGLAAADAQERSAAQLAQLRARVVRQHLCQHAVEGHARLHGL